MLVGLALRPQVLVIGPLIGDIKADLGLSHAVAGLLGSIPVVGMGLLGMGNARQPRTGEAVPRAVFAPIGVLSVTAAAIAVLW